MIMIFSKAGANSVSRTDQEVFPLCLVNAQLINPLGNKIAFGVRQVPSGKGIYMQEFSNMRKYYWIEWMEVNITIYIFTFTMHMQRHIIFFTHKH